MTMKQIKDCYFDYLVSEVYKAIYHADRYKCKDFELLKLELLLNLHKLLETRDIYNENIAILHNYKVLTKKV